MSLTAPLNCSNYEVYIAMRGGNPLVCALKPVGLSFTRTLNDFSTATVTCAVDSACLTCLADLDPWLHEVLIFRNSQLVWCGPLTSLTYKQADSKVVLNARDLLAWAEKRLIELKDEDYEVEDVDIAEVFNWVLGHGYAKDPWGMTWTLAPTGVPISKLYPGYFAPDRWGGSYPVVATELRGLSQAGIDYCVINRHLYGGDLAITPPVSQVLKIADQNWTRTPDVTINGATMSSRTVVAGGRGGYWGWYDDQIWIEETTEPYGLLETFVSRGDASDADTTVLPNIITQEAAARHAILKRPVARIAGGQLSGQNPYDFNQLIPGLPVEVGLVKSLRNLEIHYRMYSLSVDVSAEAEAISMSLSSPGIDEIRI